MRNSPANQTAEKRRLTIELLALDLNTCGRCTGTDANLDSAIDTVAQVLSQADVEVQVRKTVVKTAQQAEQLRFESSPTIRINGRDIALDLRETKCDDCAELCGCNGQVDCRVWVWQGKEYEQAPKALIIDAILRAYHQAWDRAPAKKRFQLPENLRKFFEGSRPIDQANNDCCDRTLCCDESEKDACCGPVSSAQAHTPCGCGS